MRYFLHLRDGETLIEDFEGEQYVDLNAAQDDAIVAARQMMAEKIRHGEVIDGQVIEICDEDGALVATVRFSDQLALPHRTPVS